MNDIEILAELFKNQSPQAATSLEADELILVVDRSGSMINIASDAQKGINSFVEDQRKVGPANLTLVDFDDIIRPVYTQVDINTVEPYRLIPRNGTALYDAVGVTLANAESIQTTGKKIVVIVTDGAENASKEWTREMVFKRIEQLKEAGWSFLFLAANMDAMQAGSSLGINPGSTIQYSYDSLGTSAVYAAAANFTSSLRGGMSLADTEAQLTERIATTAGLSRSDVISAKPGETIIGQGVAGPYIPEPGQPLFVSNEDPDFFAGFNGISIEDFTLLDKTEK